MGKSVGEEEMKKRINTNTLIYTVLIVLCIGLIVSMFLVYLFTDVSEILASIVALLSTVIGAFASLIEYIHNKAIDLSNDIISIYQTFIDIPDNKLIQYKLEVLKRRNVNLFTEEDKSAIRNYLLYFNGVAEKILSNNISIKSINTILGYRFFLAMNCPYIQDTEIIPNAQMYVLAIQLHNKWRIWAKKNHFERSGDATSLDKRFDDYYKYAEMN